MEVVDSQKVILSLCEGTKTLDVVFFMQILAFLMEKRTLS